jgi:hypothetical protein
MLSSFSGIRTSSIEKTAITVKVRFDGKMHSNRYATHLFPGTTLQNALFSMLFDRFFIAYEK